MYGSSLGIDRKVTGKLKMYKIRIIIIFLRIDALRDTVSAKSVKRIRIEVHDDEIRDGENTKDETLATKTVLNTAATNKFENTAS